ncbi:MAG TPA: ATP-binding protein [Acetobacteraceae bacterium]|jgi:signal transduction histidine kinase
MTMLVASGQWLELLGEPAALIAHPGAIVVAANMRFGAVLRREPAALIGTGLPSLIDAGDLSHLSDSDAGPVEATLRIAGTNGVPGTAWHCDFGPMHAGHRLLRLLPARDADALQGEVAELQQKLAWFREAIDKVGHSVVIFDQQGRLVLCNKFYRDGYRSGDRVLPADIALEGKTYRELMELRVRYRLHKEFADDPDRFIEDRVRRFEDGTDCITYLATGAVVRSQYRRLADGVHVYIGTDISELVDKEQQQRATELAYRTKSQFLANMSHELRTPLNAIIGFSQLIRDASAGPVDARYRSYADDIHAAGQHLLDLINDILDLSKIEVGRMALREELVDIADVVRKCGRLVQASAREKGQGLEWELSPDLPYLRADELRLKQILLNLLSNAIKFTPQGGCIRIAAASRPDGAVVLSVADNGIGMRSEDIVTALTPFQQIDRGLSRGRDGTGLGLPLAKTLAELHGATFDVESRPGIGTTVVIAMPPVRTVHGDSPRHGRP